METQPEILKSIVSRYGPTTITANQFFVSWNSVVTLAYESFSRTLLLMKAEIQKKIPGLQPEEPGSKWPKTTLGCLKEGVELTEEQVFNLRKICELHKIELQKLDKSDLFMDIEELCCVTFHCRSLERQLFSKKIQLAGRAISDDNPAQSHFDLIAGTMAQFGVNEHNNYFPNLTPQGRTIDSYYRTPHIETTLIYELKPSLLLYDNICKFRLTVDKLLPDCYSWFASSSWHMTIRSLVTIT